MPRLMRSPEVESLASSPQLMRHLKSPSVDHSDSEGPLIIDHHQMPSAASIAMASKMVSTMRPVDVAPPSSNEPTPAFSMPSSPEQSENSKPLSDRARPSTPIMAMEDSVSGLSNPGVGGSSSMMSHEDQQQVKLGFSGLKLGMLLQFSSTWTLIYYLNSGSWQTTYINHIKNWNIKKKIFDTICTF